MVSVQQDVPSIRYFVINGCNIKFFNEKPSFARLSIDPKSLTLSPTLSHEGRGETITGPASNSVRYGGLLDLWQACAAPPCI
jgi:hypothetical protein